jgi:hypothetical protein
MSEEGDKGFQIRQDVQLGKLRRQLLVPAVLIRLQSLASYYYCAVVSLYRNGKGFLSTVQEM